MVFAETLILMTTTFHLLDEMDNFLEEFERSDWGTVRLQMHDAMPNIVAAEPPLSVDSDSETRDSPQVDWDDSSQMTSSARLKSFLL